MSQATYKTAIEFVLKWEVGKLPDGGYTNNPSDPGGETKYGIAKRYHPQEDIKNLTLERALEIYRTEYWDVYKTKTPDLDLDICRPDTAITVFDAGVNCGVGLSLNWYLQTIKEQDQAKALLGLRRDYYYSKKNVTFLNGWLARLNDLSKLVDVIRQDAGLS